MTTDDPFEGITSVAGSPEFREMMGMPPIQLSETGSPLNLDADIPLSLTPAERERYEAAGKATPGPYSVCPNVHDSWGTIRGESITREWGTCRTLVASTMFEAHVPDGWQCSENWTAGYGYKSPPVIENNARNIALNANPATVQATLRELSRLRGLILEWAAAYRDVGKTAYWTRLGQAEAALREEAGK